MFNFCFAIYIYIYILSVVKRNPLFLHEIEWKNNGFLFTTPNIYIKIDLINFYKKLEIATKIQSARLDVNFNENEENAR